MPASQTSQWKRLSSLEHRTFWKACRLRRTVIPSGEDQLTFEQFHDHYFEPLDRNKTVMRDVMRFSMPLYLGSILLERMLVKNRLKELLTKRNELIKAKAEAGGGF